jgi:predicted dehydrogenase
MKVAVIGVGYLGRFHAQKYASIKAINLIGVCDASAEQAQKVAQELNTVAYTDYKELIDKVDLVSIVVPTQLHFEVAKEFLQKGIHILLEKPITTTVAQADELIEIAKKTKAVLQVGHLERFNPALMALSDKLDKPIFIEVSRLAVFNPRGADVNVILDLMIHDIDIIHSLLGSPIKKIDTLGIKVLTNEIDMCNARLEFENGCVANVSASRVTSKAERKMRIFQHDSYMTIDFQEKTLAVYVKDKTIDVPTQDAILSKTLSFDNADALMDEIVSFIATIKAGGKPVVSGEDGRDALLTALTITDKINNKK